MCSHGGVGGGVGGGIFLYNQCVVWYFLMPLMIVFIRSTLEVRCENVIPEY